MPNYGHYLVREPRYYNPPLIDRQTNPSTEFAHFHFMDGLLLFLIVYAVPVWNGRAKIRVIPRNNYTYRFKRPSARARTFFDEIIHRKANVQLLRTIKKR